MINADQLIKAYGRLRKASGWKASTQRFGINLLSEVTGLLHDVRTEEYKPGKGKSFILNEQGRLRLIRALEPRDMILEHALCDNILNPTLQPYIIHDNGASMVGKGISFTRRRFEQHLHKFYRQYGRDGYILKIDFRKFFDNIRHDVLLKEFAEHIPQETIELLKLILQNNAVDVTGFEDKYTMDNIYNALEHYTAGGKLEGKTILHKSLAIGAPISQIAGIYLPHRIDSWCKTVKGCKFYHAYMDDRIIIHHDKQFLRQILADIMQIAETVGIHINSRKTQIIKLTRPFVFLKTRYFLTDTGKLIKKIPKDVVKRQQRKMRKMARLAAEGQITLKEFQTQYKSWRGDKKRYHAYRTLRRLDSEERKLEKWIKSTHST
ncbi:reverse transcriptase domain-containing protein [Selenomonas ruminis]|uniref:Reverse transcriptase (RNA-dependent DNA polymerase) n=1 Tax=Selenomonas ruminis TaxID=2593411 RepID=A0A5D6W9H6_9FIRM|nr:reverse transcriptase domain-containing protein [Selenomonas sp. mPRGC5]TYZ24933.1 Reverse transcriptase (RNA-dependent DNA polymerase) [Selenomonas sp. mPRGC5]